jgi:hypothetical protein
MFIVIVMLVMDQAGHGQAQPAAGEAAYVAGLVVVVSLGMG